MKWLVIVLCAVGMVRANGFPPPFDKLPPEEAAVAFKQFLKSSFSSERGQGQTLEKPINVGVLRFSNVGQSKGNFWESKAAEMRRNTSKEPDTLAVDVLRCPGFDPGHRDGNNNLFALRGMLPPDVNLEEHSGYFQGDIVMDNVLIDNMVNSVLRNALIAYQSQWPNNTVIYQFHEKDFDEDHRNAILEGMNIISNNTCVKFRHRKPGDQTYANITGNNTGCYAHVGYVPIRGPRILNYAPYPLGEGCFRVGTIIHELMHIMGFQHMHSTYDRDEHIRILEENIVPGAEAFFQVLGSDQLSNLGVEYDYESVLHYSPLAFSRNGNFTIEALKPYDGFMGQRDYVTASDWLRINRHYDCPGAWDESEENE